MYRIPRTAGLGDFDWGDLTTSIIGGATTVLSAQEAARIAEANARTAAIMAQQRAQQFAVPDLSSLAPLLLIGGGALLLMVMLARK